MGYEDWPQKRISPLSIQLDPLNPRLPTLSGNSSQQDVREEMFEAGRVREMIRSIAKSGYYPDQRVVVIEHPEQRGYIVIEGNRRVCACQALLKESRAPKLQRRFVSRWRETAEPVASSFRKIPVVVAPSREAVLHLMVSRHLNKAPVRGWSRYAQGKFAATALDAGQDIEYITEETGLSESDVNKNIREYRMYELFLGLDWNDEERTHLFNNIDKFPIEPLSRILRSPATAEKLGEVKFKKSGIPTFKWEKEKIEKFLKRLAYDAVPGLGERDKPILNSRTTNSRKEVSQYLDRLPDEVKPTPSKRSTSSEEMVEPLPFDDLKGKNTVKRKKRKTRQEPKRISSTLQEDIDCSIKNDKIQAILNELQDITPEQCPHGSALLLRTILELSLIARIKEVKLMSDCMARNNCQSGRLPDLKQLISYASASEKVIPDTYLRRAIKDSKKIPRVLMNLVAHNDQHVITPTEIRDMATRMTPLLRFLLNPGNDGHGK